MRTEVIVIDGRSIAIDARWDDEAYVWSGSSADIHGLVLETETWSALLNEARTILPDLIELTAVAPR